MSRLAKYAWGVLGFNLLVIVWGAYVRATGSGAGCGAHWPFCNGEVIPRAAQIETIVEFIHRLTSGVAFLLVLGLFAASWRKFPQAPHVRRAAAASMVFMVLEALVGAAIVLLEYVAENQSAGRALWVALHLANTFFLLASLTLTAWWVSGGREVDFSQSGLAWWGFGIGFFGILVLGISGAITALGDTLFPVGSLVEGLQQDFSPAAHFLVRLRVWHPVSAAVIGLYLIFLILVVGGYDKDRIVHRFAWLLGSLILLQLAAGLVNLVLLAPVVMQLIHLLLADTVWISLVLFAVSALRKSQSSSELRES